MRAGLGFIGLQNYEESLLKYGAKDYWQRLPSGTRKKKFSNHTSATKAISLIGKDMWDEYLTFCFERNPWDKVVSWFFYKGGDDKFGSFSKFIKAGDFSELREKGFYSYTEKGSVVVDKVCKYENLERDLSSVLEKVGIYNPLEIPHAKAEFRKTGKRYSDMYSAAEQKKVESVFEDEIDLFGYSF